MIILIKFESNQIIRYKTCSMCLTYKKLIYSMNNHSKCIINVKVIKALLILLSTLCELSCNLSMYIPDLSQTWQTEFGFHYDVLKKCENVSCNTHNIFVKRFDSCSNTFLSNHMSHKRKNESRRKLK